jgi:hypothetical protein
MEKNKRVEQNRRKFLKLGTGIIGTGLLVGNTSELYLPTKITGFSM